MISGANAKALELVALPIGQRTTFKLLVNRKTAKALGLKIPQSVLLGADKVIR